MDDVEQVDKILFKLATSDTDASLMKALDRHLAPTLLKLSSSNENVRKKVMELLVHLNKRVKNNDNVQLPMDQLLDQYQDPNVNSFVTNFTIIYLKMGFPRQPLELKVQMVPKLLRALEDKPVSHQDSIINMILPMLENVKAPSDNPEVKRKFLDLESKCPKVAKLFLDFLYDFLLLPYGSHPSIKPADPNDQIQVPPGLCEASWKRVSGESPMKAEDLEKIKAGIVRFLGNELFTEKDIAMHLVIAMADTRHSVSTEADSVMRRFSGAIDWNDKVILNLASLQFFSILSKEIFSAV